MPSPPSRPTVLVVEDDPAHAEIVRRRIDRLDGPACEVVACGRLADALEYAGESPPDLVLLDLRLPDSDTAETLDRISAFTARGARVVVLSALCTPELAAAAIAAGAADFVEKGHLDEEVLTRLVAGGDASPSATPPPAADAALPEFDLRELSARFTHDANS
ncbi:MAG: response regulator, partial [Planctomycetota bacterium]